MGVEVTVSDTGATGLVRRLARLGQEITVGVHEDAADYEDGTSVVMVASEHENGDPSIGLPQRSWLRGWVDSGGRSVVANVGAKQIAAVVDGADPDSISVKLGEASVKGILDRMARGLVDQETGVLADLDKTGHLRDSIEAQGDRL